jgi:hypothetical protein
MLFNGRFTTKVYIVQLLIWEIAANRVPRKPFCDLPFLVHLVRSEAELREQGMVMRAPFSGNHWFFAEVL